MREKVNGMDWQRRYSILRKIIKYFLELKKDIKTQTELTQIKSKLKYVLVQLRNKIKRKC